jgi:hypothetical protein
MALTVRYKWSYGIHEIKVGWKGYTIIAGFSMEPSYIDMKHFITIINNIIIKAYLIATNQVIKRTDPRSTSVQQGFENYNYPRYQDIPIEELYAATLCGETDIIRTGAKLLLKMRHS